MKNDKDKKDKLVGVKITQTYYEKLMQLADKEKRTLSDFIRVQLQKLIPE